MSSADFQFCKTSHNPLMQMSNCAFNQNENLTFKLPFVYLHMQICTAFDHSWLTVGFFASVWRRAVFPGGPCCGREHGGGLRHYKSVIPSASGVSAWLHYTGHRLLRTKRGVMGVHATKLQSKGIRQGDSCLLTAEYFSEDQLQFLLLYLSICPLFLFFFFVLITEEKLSETY